MTAPRALLFALLLSGIARAGPCPTGPGTSLKTKEIVNDALLPYQSDANFSGVVVGVVRPGESPSTFTFGKTKVSGGSAVTSSTLFQIGSITKAFTGLLLAVAVNKNLAHLNDEVGAILPSKHHLRSDRKDLKLVDLATHTSGLGKNSCVKDCPAKDNTSGGSCDFSLDDLWQTVAACPLVAALSDNPSSQPIPNDVFSPPQVWTFTKHDDIADVIPFGKRVTETTVATQYHYSNVGFAALGRLLERKIGTPWEKLIANHITTPLGMSDTAVQKDLSKTQKNRRALPSGKDSGKWLFGDQPTTDPAAGLYSTGDDMLKFLQAVMGQTGDSHMKAAVTMAVTPSFTGPGAPKGVGFAWGRGALLETGCAEVVSKDGATPGFHAWIAFVPSDATGVVVMANWSNSDDTEPTRQIAQQILRALHGGPGL
jgi:serine-type D-Ala-D-Ala carboxypeptidase/endopeptidase